jgi:predicted DsbA family dithiol-disulfide isomerase
VGKRRLETALARNQGAIEADVRWRPFQLNDGLPKGKGMDKMEMYSQLYGEEKIKAMVPYMKQVGEEVGIDFSYGGFIGNTFDSHRFIWKAREIGGSELQNKMVDALFAAYFENEESVGDPEVLEACADKAGMPKEATEALLKDESLGKSEVEKERKEFLTKWNCRGVPLFVIDGKYPLSGAQPPEAFDEIFEELLDE